MSLMRSFALLVGAIVSSTSVHGQNPYDVQRQYQEQQRERQERDRQEQRSRDVQRDHDQLMGQYDRDRNRASSSTANQGDGAPSAVGTVIALGVAVTLLEALNRASQHRTLIGNEQPMTRLCLVHPMTRWPAQVYYQWSGDPKIYSITLRSTYNSGREEYTLLAHPSATSVRVQLTPFEADDPPKVFELSGLPNSLSERCRSLPTYAWRFGRGAAINSMAKTQALR
jgi:hypothetical protein